MNRGRGRQNIFHSTKYFSAFLDCLSEIHQKFGGIVHAYCLMSNHYHLILETPKSNLSRVMRHINGVYTQRYNKLKQTDGPLFRGRFKAILIDEENYLLNVNRYIHRNPIKLVEKLEDYKWSSYPSYLGLKPSPEWLNRNQTLGILVEGGDLKNYKFYVEGDDVGDDFIKDFYAKKILPAVMGNEDFKKKIYRIITLLGTSNQDKIKNNLNDHITSERVIKAVAKAFEVEESEIVKRQLIRSKNNLPRKLAMYLCQEDSQNSLSEIQKIFNLNSVEVVGNTLSFMRREIKNNKYEIELNSVRNLYVI